ncbi:MAG: c-type cytochrome biogenesis protein CcmI [Proteobacteria bacterium]|nr:c-type cytochrome biogenesis protein CcmI [Pseudomonadota bacterium]
MMLFWMLCALLVLLAVAFVALPLLRATRIDAGPARAALNAEVYRDHLLELDRELADGVLSAEQHAIARAELDRRALAEAAVPAAAVDAAPTMRRGRWLASGVLALVPVLAITGYLALGNPAALNPPDQQFLQMVDALAEKLKANPDDAQGWVMLARAYQITGRMPESVAAYEKASALRPDDANLIAGYADALAMVQGSLSGKPFELIVKALKLDPKNQTALALAATAAMENGQFAESIALWRRLAAVVEPGSADRTAVDQAIEQVRQVALAKGVTLADAPPVATGTGSTQAKGPAAAGASISGEVTLAPELMRQAKPDEAVFIFARAVDGPPLPLAVVRATVKDLPIRFTLDDSMSMAPTAKLSMHKQVVVSARVSRSGQAMPQPGDLIGTVQSVTVGSTGVQVRIADVVR